MGKGFAVDNGYTKSFALRTYYWSAECNARKQIRWSVRGLWLSQELGLSFGCFTSSSEYGSIALRSRRGLSLL
jgi:hypothetical protein